MQDEILALSAFSRNSVPARKNTNGTRCFKQTRAVTENSLCFSPAPPQRHEHRLNRARIFENIAFEVRNLALQNRVLDRRAERFVP